MTEKAVEIMKRHIKRWYANGTWGADMVENAVAKGLLTREEADGILGGEKHG